MRTVKHDPDDEAEVAAVQTPEGEPDAELIDPESITQGPEWLSRELHDEESEEVAPE
jgi:hypothetical protein